MNIKETLEKLNKYTEAKEERINSINFENIGCGFDIEVCTSTNNTMGIFLSGYSNNSGKGLDFCNQELKLDYKGTPEERKAVNDKYKELKVNVKAELLQAANEFDNKVAEIMNKYGFVKEV